MTLEVGIVCGACDWLNQHDRTTCADCGKELALLRNEESASEREADQGDTASESHASAEERSHAAAQQEAEGEPMEQARHYVCESCYSPVPSGHKFCGKCGSAAENPAVEEPDFFGEMQVNSGCDQYITSDS